MGRPKARELTERELEIMHLFWDGGEMTAIDVRERLDERGRDLAYTTVATLIKILVDKGFLERTNDERPYRFVPVRSFDDVSQNLLSDLVDRVFRGSRAELLVKLMDNKKLNAKERQAIESILKEEQS